MTETPIKKQRAGHKGGRKAIDGAKSVERCNISIEPCDKEKLRLLGGSAWIRKKIKEADLETEILQRK